jgi:hypothetical protein
MLGAWFLIVDVGCGAPWGSCSITREISQISQAKVPLLRGGILAVSSQPLQLQIAQRGFGVRFMCV